MNSALGKEASLGKTLEVRETVALLENTAKFRGPRALRAGAPEPMGREDCEEAGVAREKGVQTLF